MTKEIKNKIIEILDERSRRVMINEIINLFPDIDAIVKRLEEEKDPLSDSFNKGIDIAIKIIKGG